MRNRWGIVVLVALAAAAPASAEEWQKTYPVSGVPAISIDADDALVEIRAWDRNEVSVRVESDRSITLSSGNGDIRITEHQSGNAISVALRERRATFRIQFRWKATRVEVRVPKHSRLDIRTGDGTIDVAGIEGDLLLHSGDGAILAADLGGHMRLETADGRIIANRIEGDLSARTGDGRVRVDGRFTRLDLESGDGSIVADVAAGSALAESWRIQTRDGSITLRVPANLAAIVDADTRDGRIRMQMDDQVRGEVRRRSARLELNGGGPTIRLRSGDGSIRIERE